MDRYIASFRQVDATQVEAVGGKAANLGELLQIDGVRVPPGFSVTTSAFDRMVTEQPTLRQQVERLAQLKLEEIDEIRAVSGDLREGLATLPIPGAVAAAIVRALEQVGEGVPCAVRSSATAEDLPSASFAGQQDSFLNIVGAESILRHVSRCWASLFSERAVTYRLRNGIDHRRARMAVIVQRMLFPEVSGLLFTADPLTGHRGVSSIEAAFGLGEVLASGRVSPDVYKVRDGEVVDRTIAEKRVALTPSRAGGTTELGLEPEQAHQPALTDEQAVRLAQLGRRIEAHFGRPQDIEWCLVDGDTHVVQSRPITTLFPIPAREDGEHHVYLSVGHQQMMTDAIRPLGISFWQLTAGRPMYEAGGRLFVDVTRELASPASREGLLGLAGRSDPLIGDALRRLIERGDLARLADPPAGTAGSPAAGRRPASPPPIETDPAIVAGLIERSEASIAAATRDIRTKSGPALLEFILEDIQELKRILMDPRSYQVILASIEAAWWLNERLESWLGEKNVADTLSQSVSGNVTSEMGLALLDVADAIRPYPGVVAFLEQVDGDDFLDGMSTLEGGPEAREAIESWLRRYGMRGPGEIDITRPRWSERPSMLLPGLLGNVRNFTAGEAVRRFERGSAEAARKEAEVLQRLRAQPDGERKAEETRRMIARLRTFAGFREYPKYAMIRRYFVYKDALLQEADRLRREGVLRDREDVFHLAFEELQEVVRSGRADQRLIQQRREEFRLYETLTPPRVLTSEGEAVTGSYGREGLPAGALIGLPVSAGTVEGRARVVLDVADAHLEPGDILVTVHTDPSWTPLFVAIEGLVTEVGGMMSHGSVIAREYGLSAVVGVEKATRRIRDGQRIRVHGTEGYVEVLD